LSHWPAWQNRLPDTTIWQCREFPAAGSIRFDTPGLKISGNLNHDE
jgi:hypothetical protein